MHLIQLAAAAANKLHGATPEEIRHAVLVLTGTIGFPTVAAAMSWVDDVIESRY